MHFKYKNSKISETQLSSIWPIDRNLSVLPLRAWVDMGAMAMKGFSAFPESPALLEPHHQIV